MIRGKSSAGFTITELLAVIAIIAILTTIIIPVIGRVREAAHVSQCGSNLRQVGVALALFAQDNDGYYPEGGNGANQSLNGCDFASQLIMAGYVGRRSGMFSCPSDPGVRDSLVPVGEEALSYRYISPSMAPEYRINKKRHRDSVATPERTAMLTEWHSQPAKTPFSVRYTSHGTVYAVGVEGVDTRAKAAVNSGHRDGSRHFLFFDGHVAFLPFEKWPSASAEVGTEGSIFWGADYARVN